MMNTTPRISLRGLRTFCAAARSVSFSTAADDLFVTASAVSHQIKSLERELGQQLFERNSRSLSLTDSGRSLFEDVYPLMAQIEAVTARYTKRDTRTSLRISVQPFFASELFIPQLDKFTERHPEIDIQLDTNDESSEKLPANADLAIRLFREPPPNADADLLFPLRLVPAGSPAFLEQLEVSKKKICSRFPIIVHDSRPNAWRQWAKVSGIELPEEPKIIRLDSMIAVTRAAERGIGAALVPVSLSRSWFETGVLEPLFEQQLVIDEGYYVVCSKGNAKKPQVTKLREWVLQNLDDRC